MSKAIVFSGQGAQTVGMGKDLADTFPECKELYDIADETLGFSISKICFTFDQPFSQKKHIYGTTQ